MWEPGAHGDSNIFGRTLGEAYIDEAFHRAHELDPDAQLFLNEFFDDAHAAGELRGGGRALRPSLSRLGRFHATARILRRCLPPTTYMVLAGLRHVGQRELASRIAEQYVEAVLQVFEETGTLWENLAPDARQPGKPAQADFCGWAGLGSVAIPHEFLGMCVT